MGKNDLFQGIRSFFLGFAGLTILWAVLGTADAEVSDSPTPIDISQFLSSVRSASSTVLQPGQEPARVAFENGHLRMLGAPGNHFFPVSEVVAGNPMATAKNFMTENGAAFGVESNAVDFLPRKSKARNGRSYERFQQTYSQIPVFGAEVIVQLNGSGGVEYVNSDIMRATDALDEGKVSIVPTVSADDAEFLAIERIAERHPGVQLDSEDAQLMIYEPAVVGNSGSTRLVWQTAVVSVSVPTVNEFFLIDAHTGEVALQYTQIMNARFRQVYDAANTDADPGTLMRSEGEAATGLSDVDDCYDFLGDTYDFYFNEHGRDSIDNAGMILSATVRICPDPEEDCPFENAFWSGSRMYFGEGFVVDDVTAHEMTHGVTEYESNLIYQNESGAINESLSDMWGEWVDLTNGAGNDDPSVRWLMGEDIGAGRNMADPPAFGDPDRRTSPLWYTGSGDNGGVHTNSGVGNKLCYLLTDGDTFNGQTITGMGISMVADLFYEAQTTLLTSGSNYADLHAALTQAAINLGWSVTDQDNLENACLATELSFTPQPPSNDACVNAVCVADGVPVTGTTLAATGSDITSCTLSDTADVWYSYTPAVTSSVTVSLCGSDFDTSLAVFSACGGTELACNDDSCGLQSQITLTMTAGSTYLIRISGYGGTMGNYVLTVTGGQGTCGPSAPLPPAAQDGSVNTLVDTAVPITLVAADDGLPDPPGAMTYIIASLPSNGELSDPGNGVIDTVPYSLVSFGNQVIYTPDVSFSGSDSFYFLANDGGTPPDGGDSNIAAFSVTVGDSDCAPLPPADPAPSDGDVEVPINTLLQWRTSWVSGGSPALQDAPTSGGTVYEGTEDPILKEEDCASEASLTAAALGVPSTGGPDAGGYYYLDNQESGGPEFDWIEVSGTGTNLNLSDDSYYFPINLPFGFDFYGTDYTQVAVGSNGGVYFEDTYLTLSNSCMPGDFIIDRFIAVYWDDLYPGYNGGAVYYQIVGNAPNRMLVVQYQNVYHCCGTGSGFVTAQVQLHENGDILLLYADPSSEAGQGGTVGIQNDPSTGLQYLCNERGLSAGLAVLFTRNPSGTDPAIYDVYLGTGLSQMELVATDLEGRAFKPCILDYETTYYWKVVAKNDCGQTTGPIWSFTTEAWQPLPEDGAVDVPINTLLEWSGPSSPGGGNCDEPCGVENGGFETGQLDPWVTVKGPGGELMPWMVFDQDGLSSEGIYCAISGFDGDAGLFYDLYQEVEIPGCAPTAILTWSDFLYWELAGGTLPREYTVSIQPAGGGAPLAILYSQQILPGTENDDITYVTHSVDLLELAPSILGQTVRINFHHYMPESWVGYALLILDGISLTCGGEVLPSSPQTGAAVQLDTADIETLRANYELTRQQALDAAQQVRSECAWQSTVETGNSAPQASVQIVAAEPSDEQFINGDFETGTLDGWTLLNTTSNGTFVINDGTLDPASSDTPLPPYSGDYSAMSDMDYFGVYTIYQDVSLPADAAALTLQWADMIHNHHGVFDDPDQEYRVEIWNLNNQPRETLFSTDPGDPLMTDWTERSADLEAFAGQTVRIAFTVDVQLFFLNVHLDNIRIDTGTPPPPEPSIVVYDVYLGTDVSQMELVGTDLEEPEFKPCILDYETTYYWKVVAKSDCSQTTSPIWSFTTEAWQPLPEDGAVDVPINTLLEWNGPSGGGGNCDESCGVENGGFETGQFDPWVAVTGEGGEFQSWTLATDGSGNWFSNGMPFEGTYFAQNGFDGEAGLYYDLYQEAAIPVCASSVILTWSDRIQWDMTFGGSLSLPRDYIVTVQPAGGGTPLAVVYSMQLQPGIQGDTGYVTHSVDLLDLAPSIAGQTVRINFHEYIPESFTGPAQFDLDGISLVCGGQVLATTTQSVPGAPSLSTADIEALRAEYNTIRENALATPTTNQTVQTTNSEGTVYEGTEDPILKEQDCASEASLTAAALGVPSIGGPDAGGYYYLDNQEPGGPEFDWIEISTTGTNLNLSDDSYYFPISLPFGFDFYGTDYTQVAVGSNGGVYFENTYLSYGNSCMPGDFTIDRFIAVYWDDLYPGYNGGAVYYQIVGNAPNRMLVVQYQNVYHCCGTGSGFVTAQAQLHENGDILLLYADPSSEAGQGGTVGIQNDSATGLQYSCNEPSISEGLAILFTRDPDGPDEDMPADYDVYLGTDISQMELVATDLDEPVFNPCILDYETTYFWQVILKTDCGQTTSPIWSFTTEAWQPLPENGVRDVPIDTMLNWNGPVGGGTCDEPCGVENGGFETGQFDPWVTVKGPGGEYMPWIVYDGSELSSEGIYCAVSGFDGDAGLFYDLYQEVEIPGCAPTAILTWSDFLFWEFAGGTLTREYTVSIQPAGGGAPLAILHSQQILPGTENYDITYVTHSVDLLELAPSIVGQTVRINFHHYMPESWVGEALLFLDGISLTCGGEVMPSSLQTSTAVQLDTADIEALTANYELIRQQALDAAQQVRSECVWQSADVTENIASQDSIQIVAKVPSDGQIANGDFETGTLDGWTLLNTTSSGTFVINDGTLEPLSSDDPLPPYSGNYSAMTDMGGPGYYTIYQDVSLPADAAALTLQWADMLRNHADLYQDPGQEFCVEIWDLNNQPLETLFSTEPGDPPMTDWTERSADLAAFAGQTVRIAFTADVQLYFFNVHLDNIRIDTGTPPLPLLTPVFYDVYFGLNPNDPSAWNMIGQDLDVTECDPTPEPNEVLRKGRVYYWQVVAKNESCGEVISPVWSFTTENTPPVANAGPDQVAFCWINGMVCVSLDGSGSYDEDENPITYHWSWVIDNQTFSASGVSPAICLPASVHTITLVVNDGIDDSEPEEIVVDARPPVEFSVNCTPKSLNCESNGNWIKAHFTLPAEYSNADIDTSAGCTLEPMGLQTHQLHLSNNEQGQGTLSMTFDRAAFCDLQPSLGFLQLTPTGRLKNGQYFYANDEIRILNYKMEHLLNLANYWLEGDCGKPHWCNGQDINADGIVDMRDLALIE